MVLVPWPRRRRVRANLFPRGTVADQEVADGARYIVCGDDPLTQRLVEELAVRYRLKVTVILPSRKTRQGPEIARLPGVRVVERTRLDAEAFKAAGVQSASGLALVNQDDVGNLHAALQAQELNPDLRLVVRMFNMSLGYSIRRLLRHCRVLSDASIAAPAFVASALGEVAPSEARPSDVERFNWIGVHLRVPGRTLYVARREDVAPADVVCGLAATAGPGEPDLLPRDQDDADLVLAAARFGARPGMRLRQAGRRVRFIYLLRAVSPFRLFGPRGGRTLVIAFLVLLALLVLGTVLLVRVDPTLSFWNAVYVTVLNLIGGVNADPSLPSGEKALEVTLAVAGLAMVPVITAGVVQAVVNARSARDKGRLYRPVAAHMVVVGLGNVGTRVIQQLTDLGVPVVAIDKTESARGVQLVRDLGIRLVIGDAERDETLRAASVQTARALVVLSTDDVVNLGAALTARAINEDIRVVLRLFDGDFADRVQRLLGVASSKSVSFLAAPAFAAAMLEREVIGTIPVKRQVLLVVEVLVESGSALHGRTVGAAERAGEVRVVGILGASPEVRMQLRPDLDRPIGAGERLIAVTTREGQRRLLAQAAADQEAAGQEVSSGTV